MVWVLGLVALGLALAAVANVVVPHEYIGRYELAVLTRAERPIRLYAGNGRDRDRLRRLVDSEGYRGVSVAPSSVVWRLRWDVLDRFPTRGWSFTVENTQTLTNDLVLVTVSANVAVMPVDPVKAVTEPPDWQVSLTKAARAFLRKAVARHRMSELITQRLSVDAELFAMLDPVATKNGFSVIRFELYDINLPEEMRRPMARAAEAERETLAVQIAALGEVDAAQVFAQAAELLGADPAAFELRALRTVSEVAAEKTSTVMVPGMPSGPRVAAPEGGDDAGAFEPPPFDPTAAGAPLPPPSSPAAPSTAPAPPSRAAHPAYRRSPVVGAPSGNGTRPNSEPDPAVAVRRNGTSPADEIAVAKRTLVERLLPLLDAIEAASAHPHGGADGLWPLAVMPLIETGLDRIQPQVGDRFDTELHEAADYEPSVPRGSGQPVVSELLRPGYRLGTAVLRRALVRVKV